MERRIRIVVSGLVQGVGYRNFILGVAEGLGLAGWVRNLPDGKVAIEAAGRSRAIDQLLEKARKGPAMAKVSAVGSEELGHGGGLAEEGFRILY